MPTNKNASFRYRVIDHCLRNRKRQFTLQTLADEIGQRLFDEFGLDGGVSRRTVMYDLNVMRSDPPRGFGAPIVCSGGVYMYTDKSYSIQKQSLTQPEVETIRQTADMLRQFTGLPHSSVLDDILQRIESYETDHNRGYVVFDQNAMLKGSSWLKVLVKAIGENRPVELDYQPFTEPASQKAVIEPYFVKEYNNRWFLTGRNIELGVIHNYALDRIAGVKINESAKFKHPGAAFIRNYHKNIMGVSIPEDGKPERILLRVAGATINYLITKPLHQSQQIAEKQRDGMILSLNVIPNFELEYHLLAYGENITVLEPVWLKQKLEERIRQMAQNYKNAPTL